ncbi:uncharacterized protein LOC144371601 isoform X3 [Ictidomys tridecemlineatus]
MQQKSDLKPSAIQGATWSWEIKNTGFSQFLLCAGCVAIQQFNGSTDQQELEDDPKIVVPLCTALRGPQFLADTTSFFFVCGAEDQTRAAHMPDSLTNVEN